MAADATNTVSIIALKSDNLDTVCFRGSAPMADLTRISQADVFDQETNHSGLQRDLSRRHALDAYEYVAKPKEDGKPRAFPEVVLNVRNKNVITMDDVPMPAGTPAHLVKVTFDLDAIERARNVAVSRMDGNHRLMYGNGDGKDRAALDSQVPFQLHVGLKREEEMSLFLDINAEQKGLNSSHLNYLRSTLTPDEVELKSHRERVFARMLADDAGSPWHGLVHLGGSKTGTKAAGQTRPVNFVALQSATKRILRKSQNIGDLSGPEQQYQLIRSYWNAVAATWPEAWEDTTQYLLKNFGVNALAELGAYVIDRCMSAGDVEQHDMEAMLADIKDNVDWHQDVSPRDGGLAGLSGNQGVKAITGQLVKKLPKSPAAAREANRTAEPATTGDPEEDAA